MLYKISAFENNPMSNQSRFIICGNLRLHYIARVFTARHVLTRELAYFAQRSDKSETASITTLFVEILFLIL